MTLSMTMLFLSFVFCRRKKYIQVDIFWRWTIPFTWHLVSDAAYFFHFHLQSETLIGTSNSIKKKVCLTQHCYSVGQTPINSSLGKRDFLIYWRTLCLKMIYTGISWLGENCFPFSWFVTSYHPSLYYPKISLK